VGVWRSLRCEARRALRTDRRREKSQVEAVPQVSHFAKEHSEKTTKRSCARYEGKKPDDSCRGWGEERVITNIGPKTAGNCGAPVSNLAKRVGIDSPSGKNVAVAVDQREKKKTSAWDVRHGRHRELERLFLNQGKDLRNGCGGKGGFRVAQKGRQPNLEQERELMFAAIENFLRSRKKTLPLQKEKTVFDTWPGGTPRSEN